MSIEAIKAQLEVLGPLKVEFTPESDEGNSIIVPINDDYDGTFFTVIGCGDKQDNLGAYMASAVNELPDLISEIDRLQRENASLLEDRYKLACVITGGEDAPGLLDSTPTSEIVEIAQHAHRMHQDDIDRAEAAEAEVKRLQAEIDRKSSTPGDHRYWEGRYRDEAAENEKLKAGIKRLSDEEELLAETTDCDVMSLVSLAAKLAEAEQLARTYEGEANQLRDVSISNRIRAEEAEAGEKKLRETLQFYANPEIYKPHPHGPAFDSRDLSYHALTALASTGGEHHAE